MIKLQNATITTDNQFIKEIKMCLNSMLYTMIDDINCRSKELELTEILGKYCSQDPHLHNMTQCVFPKLIQDKKDKAVYLIWATSLKHHHLINKLGKKLGLEKNTFKFMDFSRFTMPIPVPPECTYFYTF